MSGNQKNSQDSRALRDFIARSLAPLATKWARVVYTFQLGKKEEPYSHWGMENEYGKDATREALRTAHSRTLRELLASPLPQTLSDVEAFARSHQKDVEEAVKLVDWPVNGDAPGLSKPEAKHLDVDLETLQLLTRK